MNKDVLFLHSHETGWEQRLEQARRVFGDVKAVVGVNNILDSFNVCFSIAQTELFVMIDGDTYVFDHAKEIIEAVDRPTIFKASNDYGIAYGHGGIKVIRSDVDLSKVFHNGYFLDVSVHLDMETSNEVLSHHDFRFSPFNTWKSLFRELLKLHLQELTHWYSRDMLRDWLEHEEVREVYADVVNFCQTAGIFDYGKVNQSAFITSLYLKKFRVGLAAICRNEAKHVPRFLEQASLFDFCAVLDTGSSDDTLAHLRNSALPNLHVASHDFTETDFSAFRNKACELVVASGEKYDVLVWLDFDEALTNFDLQRLKTQLFITEPHVDQFKIIRYERDSSHRSLIPRIFRNKPGAWKFAIHEMFVTDQPTESTLEWFSINHAYEDIKTLKAKGLIYIDILRKNLDKEPQYYLFFLAFQLYLEQFDQELIDLYKDRSDLFDNIIGIEQMILSKFYVFGSMIRLGMPEAVAMIDDILLMEINRSILFKILTEIGPKKKKPAIYPEIASRLFEIFDQTDPGDVMEPCYFAKAYDKEAVAALRIAHGL
jgi:hypothetical protein